MELARILGGLPRGLAARGRGDVDFAAERGGILLVGEVKTRLVPRALQRGPEALLGALEYHLAGPGRALEAWRRLARRGLLEESSGLDQATGVAELYRGVLASRLLLGLAPEGRAVAAGIFHALPRWAIARVLDMVGDAARAVAATGLVELAGHAVLTLHPPGLLEEWPPRVLLLECAGPGCRALGLPPRLRVAPRLGDCPGEPPGLCAGCRYRRACPLREGLRV